MESDKKKDIDILVTKYLENLVKNYINKKSRM